MKTRSVEPCSKASITAARVKVITGILMGITLLLVVMTMLSCSKSEAEAGPNGGDVVPLNDSKAEVVANADTGDPHPTATDPRGFCSRFYGQADWLRGGKVNHGWLSGGMGQSRHEFAWNNCWRGGAAHGPMWNEMGEHRRGMKGRGPGAGMGHQ